MYVDRDRDGWIEEHRVRVRHREKQGVETAQEATLGSDRQRQQRQEDGQREAEVDDT